MKTRHNSLAKALAFSALIIPSIAQAQSIEGDTSIDTSMSIIDVKSQSELTVIKAPDFGQIVRPEGNDLCTYSIKSNGETVILDEALISVNGTIINNVNPLAKAGCAFLASTVPPQVELDCPAGQRLDVGGFVDTNGVEARFSINGDSTVVECTGDVLALDAFVQVKLTRDSQIGAQAIVVPIDVLFQ